MVTLEDFFTDNDDQSSVGETGKRQFTPQEFFAVLSQLRRCDGVHDILVELTPPKTTGRWPSAETIWIVTSLSRSELPRHLPEEFWEQFLPDDWLSFPRLDGCRTERLDIPDGMQAFGFWYH
ncbi:hypothetical protein [Crateriforma spongiae]|uniref:hypothetical protein n=1 Tax=Crateriforma spongiae TaxID=2724528 RepID=UPI0039AEAA5A